MSKTFPSRDFVKTKPSGRGTSNDKPSYLNNPSQGRGRGNSSGATPILNSSRGAGSSGARGRTSTTSTKTRMQNNHNRMDGARMSGYGANPSPQRPDGRRDAENGSNEDQGSQTPQYTSGFTKFEANARKRQQVSEMARKETEAYERYKQENALKHCSYVGTTGGGQMTEEMVRRRQASDVRNQKFNRLQNQEKLRQERKGAEQREIDLKRSEARRKADENARRESPPVKPEDLRMKREGFLRQIEAQTKASTAGANYSTNSTSSPPSTKTPTKGRHSHSAARPSYSSSPAVTGRGSDIKTEVDDESFPEEVASLAAMFPNEDVTYLNELFEQTGSIDAVLDIIGV